jgi:hypothetical protein
MLGRLEVRGMPAQLKALRLQVERVVAGIGQLVVGILFSLTEAYFHLVVRESQLISGFAVGSKQKHEDEVKK